MSALTAKQAAQELGLSARKLYELAATGKLACYRFDGAIRFDGADIQAYKQSCRLPATTSGKPAVSAPIVSAFRLSMQPLPDQPVIQPPTKKQLREAEARLANKSKENRAALVRHDRATRRAIELMRTPVWADMKAIKAVYAQAQRLTTETGISYHVDHWAPLQGELVSGLHVHQNLQILTASANSAKKNHFEVQL